METVAGKATGSVFDSRGKWFARISLGHKKRPGFMLKTGTAREEAEARAGVMARLVNVLRGAAHLTEAVRADKIDKTLKVLAKLPTSRVGARLGILPQRRARAS